MPHTVIETSSPDGLSPTLSWPSLDSGLMVPIETLREVTFSEATAPTTDESLIGKTELVDSAKVDRSLCSLLLERQYSEYLSKAIQSPVAKLGMNSSFLEQHWRFPPLPREIQVITIDNMRAHRAESLKLLFSSGVSIEALCEVFEEVLGGRRMVVEKDPGDSTEREVRSLRAAFSAYSSWQASDRLVENIQSALSSQPWVLPYLAKLTFEVADRCRSGVLQAVGQGCLETLEKAAIEAQNFHDSRDVLICSNLTLVGSRIDKDHRFRFHSEQVKEELLAEGRGVLGHALDKYSPVHDNVPIRFSTYAVHWINQVMQRYLDTNLYQITLPSAFTQEVLALKKEWRSANPSGGLGTAEEDFIFNKLMESHPMLSAFGGRAVLNLINRQEVHSQSSFEGHEQNSGSIIVLEDRGDSERSMEIGEIKAIANLALENLEGREKRIVVYAFGLNGVEPIGIGEIGELEGISRHKVRQILQDSLRELKKSCPSGTIDVLQPD